MKDSNSGSWPGCLKNHYSYLDHNNDSGSDNEDSDDDNNRGYYHVAVKTPFTTTAFQSNQFIDGERWRDCEQNWFLDIKIKRRDKKKELYKEIL